MSSKAGLDDSSLILRIQAKVECRSKAGPASPPTTPPPMWKDSGLFKDMSTHLMSDREKSWPQHIEDPIEAQSPTKQYQDSSLFLAVDVDWTNRASVPAQQGLPPTPVRTPPRKPSPTREYQLVLSRRGMPLTIQTHRRGTSSDSSSKLSEPDMTEDDIARSIQGTDDDLAPSTISTQRIDERSMTDTEGDSEHIDEFGPSTPYPWTVHDAIMKDYHSDVDEKRIAGQ